MGVDLWDVFAARSVNLREDVGADRFGPRLAIGRT